MGDNKYVRVGEDIILTNEQKDFLKVIFELAELNHQQLETIKELEKTWNVTLIAYQRKK